jgi:hypothetical protein
MKDYCYGAMFFVNELAKNQSWMSQRMSKAFNGYEDFK